MVRTWLMLACVAAAFLLLVKAWMAWTWHHRGEGERRAGIEYDRMRRDAVDTAEARLTKPEFVRYFVASRPRATRYLIAAIVLLLVGLPASGLLPANWPWN